MSTIDENKEQREEACLDAAIQCAKFKRAKTRNIMEMLSGSTFRRKKNDRPDIIRIWHPQSRNGQDTYIGIEHFLVDQLSKERKKKLISVGSECWNHLQDVYVKGHSAVESGQDVPEDVIKKLFLNAVNLSAATMKYGYEELIFALREILCSHAMKAKQYRDTVQIIAQGCPVKLVFLIEIRCYFPDIFLHVGHSVRQNTDGLIPIFSEVVDELEKVDASLVDYIVLYITNVMDSSIADVVAVETGNVAKSLRSQGVTIYQYCGKDIDMNINIDEINKDDEGTHTFSTTTTYAKDAFDIKRYIHVLKAAYDAKHQGKSFVTTRGIEQYMYALGNNVDFVKTPEGFSIKINRENREIVLKRFDEFMIKYPIGDKTHEQAE